MEDPNIADDGFLLNKKRKKGVSKDPNPEAFWADMPYIIDITKAKEQNPKWGPKKILNYLKIGYPERTVKTLINLYFYDSENSLLFRKSVDNKIHHRKCVSREQLIDLIWENHKKDHRKAETIYESLRMSVFPVVRENIKTLFKTDINCELCRATVELPKTTLTRRPIPATYPNSRWQVDLKKMPVVKGYQYACNIVDCFSRFAFGGPTKGKTAKEISDIILKYIYLMGSPRILQSDNGKEFTNSDLAEVVEIFKTRQIHGRPYHPQSQGRIERFNRTLTEFFRAHMSMNKDWPSQLPEFYYNYNNRVNKSTKPSTPYQLFFKRLNFAPPVDEQTPYTILTEDERMFLKSAHLDVDDGDHEESDNEVNDDEPAQNEIQESTGEKERSGGGTNDVISEGEGEGNVTFEEAMDLLDNVESIDNDREPNTLNQVESVQSDFLMDPLRDASDYYKQLYNRQFGTDTSGINQHGDNVMTQKESSEFHGLKEFFQRQQYELYPLELFSEIPQTTIFTPHVGEEIEFKTNPAMNKGTAVFSSGFWRKGVCMNIKDIPSKGKMYVVKDSLTGYLFELNRYQLRKLSK